MIGMFLKLVSAVFLLCGCTCPNHFFPDDDPPPLPPCYVPERIRLALVLGGGGAKGLAHIGVLEELEKAEIPIDLIIGCSAGSIVGALYADCPNAEYVKCALEPLNTKRLLDINLWTARYGLSQGKRLSDVLHQRLEASCFEELKIPFILVATDLYSGELVRIGGGPLIPAVKASCAIPFIFVPCQLHGRVLADGGIIDPTPAATAKELGAEIVVAVDLGALLPRTLPTNLFGVATRSAEISSLWQCEACADVADVVIRPHLMNVGTFDDHRCNEIYEAGKRAAKEAIPFIQEKLKHLPKCSIPHDGIEQEVEFHESLCLLRNLPADAYECDSCKEQVNAN